MSDIDEPLVVRRRLLVVQEFSERGILETAFARSLPIVEFAGASSAGGAMRAIEIYHSSVNYRCVILDANVPYGTGADNIYPDVEGLTECCGLRLLRWIRWRERNDVVISKCYIILIATDPSISQSPIVQKLLDHYGCVVEKPLDCNKLAFLVSDVLDVPCELDPGLRPKV